MNLICYHSITGKLINGSLFAIITARGHEKNTIRKTIEWIIDNVLVDSEKITMYNNLF